MGWELLKELNDYLSIVADLGSWAAFYPIKLDLQKIWLDQDQDPALLTRMASLVVILFQPILIPHPWQSLVFLAAATTAIICTHLRAKNN